jgi:formyl-CoA transferase
VARGRPRRRERALADDPRFLTPTLRAKNQVALKEILEAALRLRDVAHWIETFRAAGVPHSRINTYAEALADPQVEAMGWVQELELPSGARTRTFASPIRINGRSLPISQRPPALGEHSDDAMRQTVGEADPVLQP